MRPTGPHSCSHSIISWIHTELKASDKADLKAGWTLTAAHEFRVNIKWKTANTVLLKNNTQLKCAVSISAGFNAWWELPAFESAMIETYLGNVD